MAVASLGFSGGMVYISENLNVGFNWTARG